MTRAAPTRRMALAWFLAGGCAASWRFDPAYAAGLDPRVDGIVHSAIGIDAHNHVDVPLTGDDVPNPALGLAAELRRSGLSAICATFAVDYQPIAAPGQAYERFRNGLTAMDAVLKVNGMTRALRLADIDAAHAGKKPTIIQAIEGCHFLEGKVDRLEEAQARGLRHIGLLHDNDASPPLGDVFTNPPRFGGLTPLGLEVMKRCNRLGMVADLAHGTAETVRAALEASSRPLILSHTGLDTRLGDDPAMARMMRPRLITADLAREVAQAGGVIGVWTHLADTPAAYAANIRAMVDTVGIDHVCIGTDTKLTPPIDTGRRGPPPGAGDHGGPPRDGPPRNGPLRLGPHGRRPGGDRTDRLWSADTGFLPVVVDALLGVGFAVDEIGRIVGGNYLRVFAASAG